MGTVTVLVSQDYGNKVSQTGCLNTTEIYFLSVLETGSLKPSVRRAGILLRLWTDFFRALSWLLVGAIRP